MAGFGFGLGLCTRAAGLRLAVLLGVKGGFGRGLLRYGLLSVPVGCSRLKDETT